MLALTVAALGASGCREKTVTPEPLTSVAKTQVAAPEVTVEIPQSVASVSTLASYALNAPDEQWVLPRELEEVSGLTDLSKTEIGCVQDEAGIVFVYDLTVHTVTRRIPFAGPGDYEGLTRVGNDLYVLRSDGVLFKIAGFDEPKPRITSASLNLSTKDNEGLCHDPMQGRLLIAPKSRHGSDDQSKVTQPLFAYDLRQERLLSESAIVLDLTPIAEPREPKVVKRGVKGKKAKEKPPIARFFPSSIAVHPVTGELFVISARDRRLALFDRQGHLIDHVELDATRYRQPEGITFLENGELIVTNEAAGDKPTLLRIVPKDTKTREPRATMGRYPGKSTRNAGVFAYCDGLKT
jgi:uncharacterized protein YjiK